MKKTEESVLWVVYRMTIHGKPSQMNAVCEQNEWDAMESTRPGYHTLVLAGIANEGEAERVARSVPHDQAILTQGITTLTGDVAVNPACLPAFS